MSPGPPLGRNIRAQLCLEASNLVLMGCIQLPLSLVYGYISVTEKGQRRQF